MDQLRGKVAIISGGARGQGEAEARLFAAEGALVVLGDVLADQGAEVAASIGEDQAAFVPLDVTSEAAWAQAVQTTLERFGRLDILVNNAGIFVMKPMLETTLEEYRRVIEVNQVGVFLGMKAVAPTMIAQGTGSIINISSVAGLGGTPGAIAYGASKWAVRGMSKSAGLELAGTGVRVNSVHPGIIDTPMAKVFDDNGVRELVGTRIPVGYEAQPSDVANLVLFLASDASSYCTGAEFVVDGGWSAG